MDLIRNNDLCVMKVLEGVIKYRWNALPVEQRDGIKNYISDLIVQVITWTNLLAFMPNPPP